MARILFAPWPQGGHVNPTFGLAKSLALRGHSVSYLCFSDFADVISRQGFDVAPIPRGSGEPTASLTLDAVTELLLSFARSSDGSALLDRIQPDIVLSDVFNVPITLMAYRERLRTATVCTMMPCAYDPAVPPSLTARVPEPTLRSSLRTLLDWHLIALWNRLQLPSWRPAVRLKADSRLAPTWIDAFCRECGYPARGIDKRALFRPGLRAIPELVLCPEAFDFPRQLPDGAHYIEPSVDLNRHEDGDTFPWSEVDPGKPLVYCALGTNSLRYLRRKDLLRCVVEAARGAPHRQFVIATGDRDDAERMRGALANVVAVDRAPQLALLRRASVMITHGGLGSVKEAIMLGVPMVVFPFAWDQPGNAARVEYHGIGLKGAPDRVSVAGIGRLIERIDAEPSFRARLAKMQAAFLESERAARGVRLIEEMLVR